MSDENVCQRCGACCAYFRVSFYWAEADDAPGGTVPVGLTEPVTPHIRCMQGTQGKQPRCTALVGEIGQSVGCSIYPLRSSSCQELQAGDDKCLKARRHHGLPSIG
ncbi:MAG TPA: YkgJ family cysteine cluster protein [Aquabacterium sp.]|nr:YkgJ family cysteine cluster protein [Aquabacterium sp.]